MYNQGYECYQPIKGKWHKGTLPVDCWSNVDQKKCVLHYIIFFIPQRVIVFSSRMRGFFSNLHILKVKLHHGLFLSMYKAQSTFQKSTNQEAQDKLTNTITGENQSPFI